MKFNNVSLGSLDVTVTMITPHGVPIRGVSPYADQLIKALRESGTSVNVIDYKSLYPSKLVPSGGAVASISQDALLHWANPRSWSKAAKLCGDVAHIQHWTPVMAPMLLGLIRRLHRASKKVLITVHNPAPHENLPLVGWFESRLLCNADALVVHNDRGRELLLSRHKQLNPGHIYVIPHGIELHSQRASRAFRDKVGLDISRRYVLTFGNLRGYKGLPTLLDAWKEVIASVPDTDLIIAGRFWRGGGRFLTRAVGRMLGAKRVEIQIRNLLESPQLHERVILQEGFVSDEDIDAYCRIASLGVFAYERFSGQSGAATRAVGWDLPLVVSDIGGLPDLVGCGEQVVPLGSASALAERLIRGLSDPELLSTWGRAQSAKVRRNEWSVVADSHNILCRKLAKKRD